MTLYEVTRGGSYLLQVQGATPADQGAYQLDLDVAGDVNVASSYVCAGPRRGHRDDDDDNDD